MPSEGTQPERYPPEPKKVVTIVRIEDRVANPDPAYIYPWGAVQLNNKDYKDYRVRLWIRREERKEERRREKRHADIDILLPGYGSVTFMADPGVWEGECEYEFFETNLEDLELKLQKGNGGKLGLPTGQTETAAGGGKIIIGPNPSPKNS
jgi:hypothetical protein